MKIRAAILVLITAFVVRIAHIWQIRDAPFFATLLGDSRAYDAWARQIAQGNWLGQEVFYQAPLYPYFLGGIYATAGRDLLIVRVCQAVVGSLACVALGYAGSRLFSRKAGICAGLMLALYAPAIFFDGLIQKSTLDAFFVCVAVALMARLIAGPATRASWLWLGVVMGGLALTRENSLVLVAVIVLWAVARAGVPIESRGASAAAFLLGVAIVILPVAVRNYAVGGGFYLTTSQFGPNFYIGNNAHSDGTYLSLRAGRGAPEFERRDAADIAERARGRQLTPSEISSYWTERAFEYIRAQPSDWLKLLGRKTALVWNAAEMLDSESQSMHEEWSLLLRITAAVGHFGVLVPLAVFGICATWAHRRRLWVLHAMLGAYAASLVLFYVFARYRFPLVPFLVLFAAAGIAAPRGVTSWRVSLGASAAAAVLSNWPLLSTDLMRAISETNLGVALYEEQRLDEAAASHRRAIAISPGYAPAHNNLGATLRAQGRLDEAIARYEEALRLYPEYSFAGRNLVNALHERGNALAARQAVDAAVADLQRAIAIDRADATLRYDLGSILLENGRYSEAVDELRAAVRLMPTPEAHNNLGIALGSLGRLEEAMTEFQAALALRPGFADAQRNLRSALTLRSTALRP